MKSVAAGNEVAVNLVIGAVMLEAEHRAGGVERADRDVLGLEIQRTRRRGARVDQIPDDFVLSVDGDGLAAGQVGQIDAVPLSLKADVEALVTQPRPSKSGTDAHRVQQVHGALLQDAGLHAVDDVVAAAVLDDDGVDAVQVQQMPEQQPRRTGADDPDLRAKATHADLESAAAHEVGGVVGAAAALVLRDERIGAQRP